MAGRFTQDEITIMNQIARQTFGGVWQKGEPEVNAYERVSTRSLMNIEYGSVASIEQLIMAQGYFGAVVDKIKANGHEVPATLQEALDATTRDLNVKLRDSRLKEIRALELKREQLLSADEKRKNIDAEIARLQELVK